MRLSSPSPQVPNMLEHTSVEKFVSPRKMWIHFVKSHVLETQIIIVMQ